MNFNSHPELEGKHAFLSASKYSWIRYDDDKLADTYKTALAATKGTELHNLADSLIQNNIKLPRTNKTINLYVNDAIGYHMQTEVVLYYSGNVFGTADAIKFSKNLLRIHDLKTGVSKASFDQLMIYVALFCLEYNIKPSTIQMELRIYQNDDVEIMIPDLEDIINIIDKIIKFDAMIDDLKTEALD